MLKLSRLFKTTVLLAIGLFGHTVSAQEKPTSNLIDNYLGSLTKDLSEEFVFGAYCYGTLVDVGVELEKWGTDDEDPEIMFGPNLSCPMVFWESEEKIGSWTRSQLKEHENSFKGTPLSYMVTSED